MEDGRVFLFFFNPRSQLSASGHVSSNVKIPFNFADCNVFKCRAVYSRSARNLILQSLIDDDAVV